MAKHTAPLKLPTTVTRNVQVIIPKGAIVYSRGKKRVLVRNQRVTVQGALDGYYRERGVESPRVAPWIYWAGSGGYWVDYRADEEFYAVNGFDIAYNEDDYNWKHYWSKVE